MDKDQPFTHAAIAQFLRSQGYWEVPFDPKQYRWSESLDFAFNKRVFVKPGAMRVLVANTCYSHFIEARENLIVKKIWFSRNEPNAEILRNASDWAGLISLLNEGTTP